MAAHNRQQIKTKDRAAFTLIDDVEAKELFDCYMANGRSQFAVFKKFKRARNTIAKLAIRENWKKRGDAIQAAIQKTADKRTTREEIKNLELIRKVKTMIGDKVLKDKKYRATVAELTQLVRLEEELLQNLPTGGTGDNVVNIVNDNSELARILANAQIGLKAVTTTDRGILPPL